MPHLTRELSYCQPASFPVRSIIFNSVLFITFSCKNLTHFRFKLLQSSRRAAKTESGVTFFCEELEYHRECMQACTGIFHFLYIYFFFM